MIATAWPFVELDDQGTAFVAGTRTKVFEIAVEHLAYRWDAEQLAIQHPYLPLPQIHAALGYYYEHREACDRQIESGERQIKQLRPLLENAALQEKLRRLKGGA